MKEIDLKYYLELQQADLPFSSLPASITQTAIFKQLVETNIIAITKNGRGKIAGVKNKESFQKFIQTYFPLQVSGNSRAANIARLRNSKAKSRVGSNISFLRGSTTIKVNRKDINLKEYTETFGLFSACNPELQVDKICFIENLEVFLAAETIIDSSFTYLHKYGRIGKEFLTGIKAAEILVFPDYDLVGLNEFLIIQQAFPTATLYIPENFDTLFNEVSVILPEKQVASTIVKNSKDPLIVKIRDLVIRSNRFLEQEILLLAL